MSEIGLHRDEWMRRMGPFYPLLVAFQLQSRLPVAVSLEPNDQDIERAQPWLPAVGLCIGLAMAALLLALRGLALAPTASAALLISAGVLITGGWFEVGLGRATELAGSWLDPHGRAGAGRLAITIALGLALLCKFGALTGTSPSLWIGGLVSAAVVARWSVLVAQKLPEWSEREHAYDLGSEPSRLEGPPRWVGFAVATAVALVTVVVAGRGPGLVALLLAGGFGLLGAQLSRRDPRSAEVMAAAAGALAEIAALFCFSS
jgi:cobalamin synthase